jgi:hypothetical protein
MARRLVGAGADVAKRDGGGFTALHAAAQAGDDSKLGVLLAAGADVALPTAPPNSPAVHSERVAVGRYGRRRWAKLIEERRVIEAARAEAREAVDRAATAAKEAGDAAVRWAEALEPMHSTAPSTPPPAVPALGNYHELTPEVLQRWEDVARGGAALPPGAVVEGLAEVQVWRVPSRRQPLRIWHRQEDTAAPEGQQPPPAGWAESGEIVVAMSPPVTDANGALWLQVSVPPPADDSSSRPLGGRGSGEDDAAGVTGLGLGLGAGLALYSASPRRAGTDTSPTRRRAGGGPVVAEGLTTPYGMAAQLSPWRARRSPTRRHPKGGSRPDVDRAPFGERSAVPGTSISIGHPFDSCAALSPTLIHNAFLYLRGTSWGGVIERALQCLADREAGTVGLTRSWCLPCGPQTCHRQRTLQQPLRGQLNRVGAAPKIRDGGQQQRRHGLDSR